MKDFLARVATVEAISFIFVLVNHLSLYGLLESGCSVSVYSFNVVFTVAACLTQSTASLTMMNRTVCKAMYSSVISLNVKKLSI